MFNGKVDEKFRQIVADMRYHYESTGKPYDFCPLCKEVGRTESKRPTRNCPPCPWWQENPAPYACAKWSRQQGFSGVNTMLESPEGLAKRLELLSRWLSTPA